ncbi:hypothetical protein PR003_g23688 [Phytophthora rubi]|uniref:Uncharacterized protein n=1 Tax=Phytophthora rubi TaxID=129364 RepID=A0A6A3KYN3_9STRA|nr:hypothetical protein PR002_g23216 [Phytophthora rubi]KAE9010678.1 hypothetical protein PR001_g16105 [Phytophthora rubi]KAE9296709.1 hypothetical protein PR003_g23688 [Phytophthora rubi]
MAGARIGVVSCAFTRFGCRSEHDLFYPSYTRSNKKRNAKLLRCFPHCCPNHVPRSYCGCSVHLLVTFESSASATAAYHNPDLLVSARFESTLTTAVASSGDVVTALAPGTMVALPANAMAGPNVTESDWISASKASYAYQQQLPENTLLYELNDRRSPMWYYSYESGSTKTQREMKHLRHTGGRSSGSGIRMATVAA